MKRIYDNPTFDLALLYARLSLGLFFLYHGVTKLMGEFDHGFGTFYHSDMFQNYLPTWIGPNVGWFFGYAWPWAEAVFGGLLVLGVLGFLMAGLIALMLIAIMISQGSDYVLFWFQSSEAKHAPYHFNIVFFGLALVLMLTGSGRASVDGLFMRRRRRRVVEEEDTEVVE